jgi:hypothetical protein
MLLSGAAPGALARLDFRAFFPPDNENLNKTSLVLFVGYSGIFICLPGDLEKDGWLALSRDAAFREYLAKTNRPARATYTGARPVSAARYLPSWRRSSA